eukprot:m.665661 g.665661  ORF g.665661 m.665661 type:complete len:56 (+) comp58495_c1_seq1:927-1094(+)
MFLLPFPLPVCASPPRITRKPLMQQMLTHELFVFPLSLVFSVIFVSFAVLDLFPF